jgi:hypothetical protein
MIPLLFTETDEVAWISPKSTEAVKILLFASGFEPFS